MSEKNNTGLGLIKTTIERVQNPKSLFNSALKKLINSSESELELFLKADYKANFKNKYLKPISSGKEIMIEALDGKETIVRAKNTFKLYLDPDFKNLDLDKPGVATAETLLGVYEVAKDANFIQMFTSLSSNLDKLVMTQSQIVSFCKKYPTWLRQDGYANLFLIKENNECFVVSVSVGSSGLGVRVLSLRDDRTWYANRRYHLIVPQLLPLAS